MMMKQILDGYADSATPELIARFDSIRVEEIYAPVLALFPLQPCRIADIGAGTGRDSAWLAGLGHDLLAVEPVDALRCAGMKLHEAPNIRWLKDALPALEHIPAGRRFDLVLLCAVWQHLEDGERRAGMRRLAGLTAPGGKIIMSLRHGPGAANRPVFPISPEQTIEDAERCGLRLLRLRRTESVQAENRANGVHWTWLAFLKPD
jgi:SAM-dependent methyltransferase